VRRRCVKGRNRTLPDKEDQHQEEAGEEYRQVFMEEHGRRNIRQIRLAAVLCIHETHEEI